MPTVLRDKRRSVMGSGSLGGVHADRKWSNSLGSAQDHHARKRQAAIAQALRTFGRQGFRSTSLDQIAAALNVTKPALYYYFRDKQDLLLECHKLCMDCGDRVFEAAVQAGGSVLKQLLRFITDYVCVLTDDLGASTVLDELDALRPEDRRQLLRRRRAFDRQLRALIDAGIVDGSIRPCDSKLTVFWFMGAIHGIPVWYREDGEQSGPAIAAKFADLLERALRPD